MPRIEGLPWFVLPEALDQWRKLCTGSLPRVERALVDVCHLATHKQTDRLGRQLWKAPRSSGYRGLKLVVDPRAGKLEHDLPVLLWVGQSRPAGWCWQPDDTVSVRLTAKCPHCREPLGLPVHQEPYGLSYTEARHLRCMGCHRTWHSEDPAEVAHSWFAQGLLRASKGPAGDA